MPTPSALRCGSAQTVVSGAVVDVLAMTGLLLWVPQARSGSAVTVALRPLPPHRAQPLRSRRRGRRYWTSGDWAILNRNFVGRDDERAIFERAVAEAREGAPAVLLVGGEAGIGRSTVVTEGARRAAADLIVGRGLPMGGELIPLAPLAELLRIVRRTHPAALSEPALAPLRDWIGRGPAAQRAAAGALFAPLLELVADLGVDLTARGR